VSPDAALWLAVAGLVVACLSAIGARSFAEFSRRELENICQRRSSPELFGQILRQREQVSLGAETLQVIATAVLISAVTWWVRWRSGQEGPPGAVLLIVAAAVGISVLLAAEIWVPATIARLWGAPFVYHTWPMWRAVSLVLYPAALGAQLVNTVFYRLADREPETADEESFEEEIRSIVTEGHHEGLLEEDAREMIEGVIELADVEVSEIMVPRTYMTTIPLSLTWAEVVQTVVKCGHTRIPVYEKNRDDIVGILHSKDMLPELAKASGQPAAPWTALLRDPYFVPETKPVDALLQEFQQTRNHMAVVLDEYGGVAGVVTMEDVLEEIVGEIGDEYDKELVDGIRDVGPGAAEALGRVHVDEINQRLGLELPEESDFDTIGGFVFSELGHVPVAGEELVWKNVRIKVLEATRRRIERIRIEKLDEKQEEEEAVGSGQ
jgi:CBS domain containing-hemolysin-like protein